MTSSNEASDARRRWMRVLAHASRPQLERAWAAWDAKPEVEAIRGPEAGLVMVRGRVGAGGDRFNLGEATVTRATVRLHGVPMTADTVGSAYVLGTDLEHAWFAAAFDGLLADEQLRERVLNDVIAPLERGQEHYDNDRRAEARSTKVDFFTVAREHA
ncbi:phosphonate C-P lyase system protein PhnG [Arthrobacter sp. M4]|uniref:phosphonate C-P lyase system protein PhnG n=1 Tax=Arthrobacter sp. M4 TaxID=218160 RepID=UPI001CDC495A|nr:phosphonate C-P lyase system protein PhnG [Arthrobacter sp. M4]MCA4132571.1 phosphonate C-P lyase system protein PhnG [Arthrobacter sp. M4]